MAQNIICIAYGAIKLCVDASYGGHIVEFSNNGKNALATSTTAIGSTFWPSPQEAWGWPPLPALDNKPYTVKKSDKELLLTSEVCKTTGLQVEKRFWFEGGRLEVNYTMFNRNDIPVKYAPWEITRIKGGFTFYESKEQPLSISTGAVTSLRGVVWHEYNPDKQKQNEKIFGNGSSGWLANAYNGLLLVKKFEPVSAKHTAPGEAEIEIYAHGDINNAYIEMEQQGGYKVIEANDSYQWSVSWYLKEVPAHVEMEQGSTTLVKEVTGMISE